jgi:hypothetical protein
MEVTSQHDGQLARPSPCIGGCGHFWIDTLLSALANSTLIMLFSEMLKFSKNYFFQIKKYCEGKE